MNDITRTSKELVVRITHYLMSGGLNNPEAMEHEKVRELLIACRDALGRPAHEPKPPHECERSSATGFDAALGDYYERRDKWERERSEFHHQRMQRARQAVLSAAQRLAQPPELGSLIRQQLQNLAKHYGGYTGSILERADARIAELERPSQPPVDVLAIVRKRHDEISARLDQGKGEWLKDGYVRDETWAQWQGERYALHSVINEVERLALTKEASRT